MLINSMRNYYRIRKNECLSLLNLVLLNCQKVICKFERLNEYFALHRNGSGEMVEFGNVNTYVNHEVVPTFHKV